MVNQVDFTDIYMDEDIIRRVDEVLRSGRHVKGPAAEEFEADFAAACETDHAVTVSNGTAALLLSMKALDIGPGDEVFVPAHTYFATVSPVLELGATPRFVDVDSERYTMDPDLLTRAIIEAEKPAAVVVTHMHGQPADLNPILDIAAAHDLPVIEDAAQAHLATYDNEPVGGIGDVGCFSFYPTKNMTVAGDGGMVTTDRDDIARRVRILRNHGRNDDGEHVELGLNYRLDETNAVVGREQLNYLPDWIEGRRQSATYYDQHLPESDDFVVPSEFSDSTHVYHHYPVQISDRGGFRAHLDENGVDTGIHYEMAVHEQPAITDQVGEVKKPVAERLCRRTVSLPMHPRLTNEELQYVCKTIQEYFQ